MNEQLIAALGTLALATVYALIAWVRATQARIEDELKRNTKLTRQAEEAAAQAAEQTGETVAQLRDRVQILTGVVRLYKDFIQYLDSTEQGRILLDSYRDRRRPSIFDDDVDAIVKRLLREARQRD